MFVSAYFVPGMGYRLFFVWELAIVSSPVFVSHVLCCTAAVAAMYGGGGGATSLSGGP